MPGRAYVAGICQLVLDGVKSGFLKSLDGGTAVAQVIAEPSGPSPFAKKHLGSISYSPFVLQFGLAMTNELYDWINASWSGKAVAKDGAIVLADQNFVAVSQREFFKAFITETTIPALDGASKEPAYLTLKFAPEYARTTKAAGTLTGPARGNQKLGLSSNFRLTIDGLDCTRVSQVDQFTIRQSVAPDEVGEVRHPVREPTRLEFPNLSITLSEASANTWFDWFDDFVIKGNNDESKEKNGSISLLSANLTDELLRIDLFNLGIFKIGPDKTEANTDRIVTVTAQLYCERMELHLGAKNGPQPAGAPRSKVKSQRSKVKSKVKSKVQGRKSKAKGK